MADSGEVVQPGVPHFLRQLRKQQRATRADLAAWITADDNPLTARVFVNRLWKLFFGSGLSKVLDDVGSQGEPPVHPELLDTLAVEFVDSGWDVKRLVKLIVMSNTYQQSSSVRDELLEHDPFNRLLARQSRFRLDAEMIRDNALAVSGLLVRNVGGRSAKPYQPAGLYRHLNFPARKYQHDTGADQYRRGLYTHWQRQFLHPAMKAFDAPSREECTAERPRSNTPLAALVLLNDPSYVEAARMFAQRTIRAWWRQHTCATRLDVCSIRFASAQRPRTIARRTTLAITLAAIRRATRGSEKVGQRRIVSGSGRCRRRRVSGLDFRGPYDPESARNDHAELSPIMNETNRRLLGQSRRTFLSRGSTGIGSLALTSMLRAELFAAPDSNVQVAPWTGVVRPLHFPAKCKRVIHLCMAGGASHLETLDYKPKLAEMDGKPMPKSFTEGQTDRAVARSRDKLKCLAPQHPFKKYGHSRSEDQQRFCPTSARSPMTSASSTRCTPIKSITTRRTR